MKMHPEKSKDVQPDRLKALLRNLVDIYSPTGKEEDILEYIERYLKRHGMVPVRQEVDENRYNLLVLPGRTADVEVCFVGHVDTVTAYDIEDYGFRDEGDTALGLGTADMKSGCAAMIEAFTVLAAGAELPPLALALVVGEEEESDGAKALVDDYSFPWAVVGEPTDLAPCLGHYGYLEVLLRTRGKRVHSSVPELGQNAIESMLKLLLIVTEYTASSPKLVYNIRQLMGYPSGFVVPDACEAWLDLHLPPDSRIDVLKAELEQVVEGAGRSIPGLDGQVRFEDTYSGYRVSRNGLPVKKLREVYRQMSLPWHSQDFRSHSDGSVLWTAGVNPIVLGPGRLEAAHTPEESVSLDQVVQAAELYLNFALSLSVGDGRSS
jgi:acetylornithine deacetylase